MQNDLAVKQAEIIELNKSRHKHGANNAEFDQRAVDLMEEIERLNHKLQLCEEAQTSILSVKQRLQDIETTLGLHNGLTNFNEELFRKLIDEVLMDREKLTFKLICGITLIQEI